MKESDLCKIFIAQIQGLENYGQFKRPFILKHNANEQKPIKNRSKKVAFGRRNWTKDEIEAAIYSKHLKRMGLLPGAPDYDLEVEEGCVAIEFKTDRTSTQSDDQKAYQAKCDSINKLYYLTWNPMEAVEFTKTVINNGLPAARKMLLEILQKRADAKKRPKNKDLQP